MKADEDFQNQLKAIANGAPPLRITVGNLLSKYSQQTADGTIVPYKKRGSAIKAYINRSFARLKVEAPMFENAGNDELIEIRKRKGASIKQVYLSLGNLEASRKPATIRDQFTPAGTIHELLSTGEEKFVVISDNEGKPIGVIGWEHVAKHIIKGTKATHAKDYLNDREPSIHSRDEKVLDIIDKIIETGFVLIGGDDYLKPAVITIHDLASDFVELSESFHLIEEIEWRIRILLIEKIAPDAAAVRKWANPGAKYKETAEDVWDLSFGELMNQIGAKDMWARLDLQLEQQSFHERIKKVNTLRNEVFHFRPKAISAEDREYLRQTCRLMESITPDEVET